MLKTTVLGMLSVVLMSMPSCWANESTGSQHKEATMFFTQILQGTHNPVIARLAQENLKKLNTAPASVSSTPEMDSMRRVEIPLLTQSRHSLAVPVLLEQRVVATFVIDTGATYTVITPDVAQKLGVVITPETPRITIITANGAVAAPKIQLKKLSLGGVELSNVTVLVQDLGRDPMLAGLLGMNVFKDMELTIRQDKLILGISSANTHSASVPQ
jgi:clan AA aspartic protease (TIGR02281 family)